jgi:D-lactate dehydrogenase
VALSQRIKADAELTALINKKFAIKCTTGYSINALVDFNDPLEMIKHLFVGSEGTFGFVSRATYHSVPDYKDKASAFIVFPTVEDASNVTWELRKAGCTDAVELFDNRSLKTCEDFEHLHFLRGLANTATALLIECRGADAAMLKKRIEESIEVVRNSSLTLNAAEFSYDPAVCAAYWDARRALIPMVGAMREAGSSVLLEDVAVPVQNLAKLCNGINEMFEKFEYHDGSAFGHALEGNLHLVFTQAFESPAEVARYEAMMDHLCKLTIDLEGSCKAEHGTGRNVAPYVELEWGAKATQIMWELKGLFDPDNLLNPGVVLNKDPKVHTQNLKPLPVAHGIIDSCMECGFCESACPSGHVTLTPRQRIVATRELARLEASGTVEDLNKAMEMKKNYEYLALDTCAADGMCSVKCPVNINTGRMVKDIRAGMTQADSMETKLIDFSANNFGILMGGVPAMLSLVDKVHGLVGSRVMHFASSLVSPVVGVQWNPYLPASAPAVAEQPPVTVAKGQEKSKVVYFVTCVSRSMGGVARGDADEGSLHEKTMSVLAKAGYEVVLPSGLGDLCCGLIFDSRGYPKQGSSQMQKLEEELLVASENGSIPILCDTSPCMARMKEQFKDSRLKDAIFEPTEFAATKLMPRLEIFRKEKSVAVHVPCSSKQMKKDGFFEKVARACSEEVTMSPVPCCGAAGDRGMRYPEISGGGVASQVKVPSGSAMVLREPSKGGNTTSNWTDVKSSCSDGYSTSRTCEIQLSLATGTHFKSIMYLLDKCARPITQKQ